MSEKDDTWGLSPWKIAKKALEYARAALNLYADVQDQLNTIVSTQEKTDTSLEKVIAENNRLEILCEQLEKEIHALRFNQKQEIKDQVRLSILEEVHLQSKNISATNDRVAEFNNSDSNKKLLSTKKVPEVINNDHKKASS